MSFQIEANQCLWSLITTHFAKSLKLLAALWSWLMVHVSGVRLETINYTGPMPLTTSGYIIIKNMLWQIIHPQISRVLSQTNKTGLHLQDKKQKTNCVRSIIPSISRVPHYPTQSTLVVSLMWHDNKRSQLFLIPKCKTHPFQVLPTGRVGPGASMD